jgi:hypothetical protein
MGRSPFFTLSHIELPSPTSTSDALAKLTVGQIVRFTFANVPYQKCQLPRAISTYGYTPSGISKDITYQVTSTDAIPCFSQIGLRAISLIDINHSNPQLHINGWYITTDGYVRECEHFGTNFVIDEVFVL